MGSFFDMGAKRFRRAEWTSKLRAEVPGHLVQRLEPSNADDTVIGGALWGLMGIDVDSDPVNSIPLMVSEGTPAFA